LTDRVPAIAVAAFALTWWAAWYLVGRDPTRPVLWRAAAALVAYAVAVVLWTAWPGSAAAQILLCVPALLWAGTAVALLPESLPERRHIDRGWLVLSALFLIMVIALPPAGRLVAVAPLIGGLVLLWRFRDQVQPPMLPAALAIAAFLYGCGLVVLLLPIEVGGPALVLAAIGLDLLMLGFLVAVADALDAGERLRPDLIRSWTAALAGTLLVGGPAALTMLAAGAGAAVFLLQFALVAVAMAAIALAGPVHRGLDAIAFRRDGRLRAERGDLLRLAAALPRRRPWPRLSTTRPEEFLRFTRQALDHYQDLGRLARSPLTGLPEVDRRVGEQPGWSAARALELRALLQESVVRLRPAGPYATTDEWRHYNALYFCAVLGLRPYERRSPTGGLDREARQALDWMRRYVPRRRLRRWQTEGAALVADYLWAGLTGADARRTARVPTPQRPGATRST
jgi:hypothetical protein